jgi:hypothetical protein
MKSDAATFLSDAQKTVNSIEDFCDQIWADYQEALHQQTNRAHDAMRQLIADLPVHSNPARARHGEINFTGTHGLARRNRFFRDMAKVYANWEAGIFGDLDIMKWDRGTPAWEKSLGLLAHRAGHFQQRIRGRVAQLAHELVGVHDSVRESIAEERMPSAGAMMAKAGIRGFGQLARLPQAGAHQVLRGELSRSQAGKLTPFRVGGAQALVQRGAEELPARPGVAAATKAALQDQEKAWLENVLRGAEELARRHANEVFDAATGTTFRDTLNGVVDKFDSGALSERQQLLSVQTHIRAMIRRIATSGEFKGAIGKQSRYFVQLPATRPQDLQAPPNSVIARAFTVVTQPELVKSAGGLGDSLGAFAGDKMQPIPIPPNAVNAVRAAAEVERQRWLKAIGRPEVPK